MTDITLHAEAAGDAAAIERLVARTFGPGRYARAAFRLREGAPALPELSFVARIGTLMVGSVRLGPIRIGGTPALVLGPLTVEPPFRGRGIGEALMQRALEEATRRSHRLVILVGDEPYYGKVGFRPVPRGRLTMPGPVDPARLLYRELVEGAFEGMAGPVTADRRYQPPAAA